MSSRLQEEHENSAVGCHVAHNFADRGHIGMASRVVGIHAAAEPVRAGAVNVRPRRAPELSGTAASQVLRTVWTPDVPAHCLRTA